MNQPGTNAKRRPPAKVRYCPALGRTFHLFLWGRCEFCGTPWNRRKERVPQPSIQ